MDILKKAMTSDKGAVLTAIDATELVSESMHRIQSWPSATVHLGQAMMAALLLESMSEKPDRGLDTEGNRKIEMNWHVRGPFGPLFVEADWKGHVRGTLLNPTSPITDLNSSLGTGILRVKRTRKETSEGIVRSTGEVGTDIVEYLEASEQRKCGIGLSVEMEWDEACPEFPFRVKRAVGYLVDVIADVDEEKSNRLLYQWDEHMRQLGKLSEWELPGDRTLQMLRFLSGEKDPQIFFTHTLDFIVPVISQEQKWL